MKKQLPTLLGLLSLSIMCTAQADRENDMWQQFKAQKGMQELDAEFEQPATKEQPQPKVIERVVEKVIYKPAPAPVVQAEPIAPPPEPQTMPEPVPAPGPGVVTVESDGFIFKLEGCTLSHRNIKCQLSITSAAKDGELTLYAKYSSHKSKLFDRQGNEYHPSSITMGNKTHSKYIANKYIAGVTAKGHFEIENINTDTASIAMFELLIHNHATKKKKQIQFRDAILARL